MSHLNSSDRMESRIDFAREHFAPVIRYPEGATFKVLDLSGPNSDAEMSSGSLVNQVFTLGKYNEERGIYTQPHFLEGIAAEDVRTVHLGIDLGGPIGTPVFAAFAGVIAQLGYMPEKGDYGNVLITEHEIQGHRLWMLFGHLSGTCIESLKLGQEIQAGELLGHLGAFHENGGWPSHLHFQLSYRRPVTHDLPGVCSLKEREESLAEFPDPRLVLGPLYKD